MSSIEDIVDPLDERDQDIAEVARKRVLEELDEDAKTDRFTQLLKNEAVRDYLWELVSRCGMFNEGFDGNFGKTGYNLGRQSVGRMIVADITLASPESWLEMQLKSGRVRQAEAAEAKRKRLKRQR